MSGTVAHQQKIYAERQAEIEKRIRLNDNRAVLLSAVASYMHENYGNQSFYNDHPLVLAIQQSADGAIIDLDQLAANIANYQLPEV